MVVVLAFGAAATPPSVGMRVVSTAAAMPATGPAPTAAAPLVASTPTVGARASATTSGVAVRRRPIHETGRLTVVYVEVRRLMELRVLRSNDRR